MKRISLFLLISTLCFNSFSQTKKKPAAHPAKKTVSHAVSAPAPLKTLSDSLSYSIGVMVANFSRQQGITDINTVQVANAINAEMKGGKPLLDQQQCQQLMMDHVAKIKEGKAEEDKKLAEAGKKEGAFDEGRLARCRCRYRRRRGCGRRRGRYFPRGGRRGIRGCLRPHRRGHRQEGRGDLSAAHSRA